MDTRDSSAAVVRTTTSVDRKKAVGRRLLEWHWLDDHKGWIAYDPSISIAIETAMNNKQVSVQRYCGWLIVVNSVNASFE